MALTVAFDEAKKNRFSKKGNESRGSTGGLTNTPFFGAADVPGFPHAALVQYDPGRISRAHYHVNDQFQVIVGGNGRIGRHDLTPYSVHFSRAYTPYGPLVSDAGTGLTFLAMRAHYDPGSQRLPDKLREMKLMPHRQPWQITCPVTFPQFQSSTAATDTMLQAVSGIKDDNGLAAYTLIMKSNTKVCAPDPSHGDGQFLVVVKGSFLHHDKEHGALALTFVSSKEGPLQIRAGAAGLEALILNFPQPQTRPAGSRKIARAKSGFKTLQCTLCSFVYDEAAGLPDEGLAPGTHWKDVPDTWNCPDCGASKDDFQAAGLE